MTPADGLFTKPSALRPAKATWLRECEIIAIERQIFFDEVAVTLMRLYLAAGAFFSHLMTPSFSQVLSISLPFSC
jgi:hypothetical protein